MPDSCDNAESARQSTIKFSLAQRVAAPVAVPPTVRAIEGLRVVLVDHAEDRALWNTLMHEEHPLGVTMFAGCQVRYLIDSGHGMLGAVGFAASALYLGARDRWMGWTHLERQAFLNRVIGLNRFLIRPSVRCRNLASHVLGAVLRRLPSDFAARYHYGCGWWKPS